MKQGVGTHFFKHPTQKLYQKGNNMELYIEIALFLAVLAGIAFVKMVEALKMLFRELQRIDRVMRKIDGV